MPSPDYYYLISTRAVRKGRFVAEPGPVRYLRVPMLEDASPNHVLRARDWFREIAALASDRAAGSAASPDGDILVFVHGYNNDLGTIRERQVQLSENLEAEGWRGLVVSFDWPSDNSVLNYVEDRTDAARVASALVDGGIVPLATGRAAGCGTNVHVLGHSTGAYVIMEAFARSEQEGPLFRSDWRIAQVAFIGADVSSRSLGSDSERARPMFNRVMRLTNYQNPFDHVLAASNAKRLGVTPRAGRVGVPSEAHQKVANVNCGPHFETLDPRDHPGVRPFAHSWHFSDRVFARDLALTLDGRIDRRALPTRSDQAGQLFLRDRPRPQFYDEWSRMNDAPAEQ